jgi:hypothetical protein
MALGPDPYEVLGVPRDATGDQIAQARRRLSRELHPDVNSAPDAAARFDQVQQAFDVLSDPAEPPSSRARQAGDSLPVWVIWLPVVVLAVALPLIWPNVSVGRWGFAPSTPTSAQPTVTTAGPPSAPVIVEQTVPGASGPGGAVQPRFAPSPLGADQAQALRDGLAGPPVQRGPELLVLAVAPPSGTGPARFCVPSQFPGREAPPTGRSPSNLSEP